MCFLSQISNIHQHVLQWWMFKHTRIYNKLWGRRRWPHLLSFSPPNMGKVKDILADDWPSNMLKKTEVCKERRWWRLRWELKGKVEAPLTWARGNFQSEATKFFEKGLIWWNYHSTLYLPICIWIIFTKIFKQAPQAEGCTFDLLIYWLSTGF